MRCEIGKAASASWNCPNRFSAVPLVKVGPRQVLRALVEHLRRKSTEASRNWPARRSYSTLIVMILCGEHGGIMPASRGGGTRPPVVAWRNRSSRGFGPHQAVAKSTFPGHRGGPLELGRRASSPSRSSAERDRQLEQIRPDELLRREVKALGT